jgi:PEP-CTERM motif
MAEKRIVEPALWSKGKSMSNTTFSRLLAGLALAAASLSAQATPLPTSFDLRVEAAVNDGGSLHPQTGALYMFGVGGMFGSASALVFANNTGRFYSVPGGSVITGEVAVGTADQSSSAIILDASRRFSLNMQFTARGRGVTASPSTGDGFGGPKKELQANAYIGAGGNIDPDTWSYFDLTGATLVGLGAFDGITIEMTQMPSGSEYPFQFGDGASGRTTRASGSMWFTWAITTATNTLLGAVGRNGVGDVYVQTGCANDSITANAMQLPLCSANVPVPGTWLLLGLGLLALARQRIKPAYRGIA